MPGLHGQIDRAGRHQSAGDGTPRTSVRRCRANKCKRDPAVLPIDQEIGIQCQHSMPVMDLGHSYDACVSQRHRRVPIFLQQPAHLIDVIGDPERDTERTILEEIE